MTESIFNKRYIVPVGAYLFLIIAVVAMRQFLPWGYVVSFAGILMLLIPYLLHADVGGLKFSARGIVIGIVASVVILAIYLACLALIGKYTDKSISINSLSLSFLLTQLLLVALPEEFFFRGYLQSRLGDNIKAVVIVSVLFAIGHFITVCLWGSHDMGLCVQSLLTFFPSLVMGYLYLRTRSLWSSIIFHFLANIVHISTYLS